MFVGHGRVVIEGDAAKCAAMQHALLLPHQQTGGGIGIVAQARDDGLIGTGEVHGGTSFGGMKIMKE